MSQGHDTRALAAAKIVKSSLRFVQNLISFTSLVSLVADIMSCYSCASFSVCRHRDSCVNVSSLKGKTAVGYCGRGN